jgi:hypothetical protein
MSIFFIGRIASITRFPFAGSGSVINSITRVGTTCHDRPNRSFSASFSAS